MNSFMAAAPADDPKVMMYYVFESADILYSNGDYFKSAFRQGLIATGVTGDNDASSEDYSGWQEYQMPLLANHSLDYANNKIKSIGVKKVVIGDGSNIIKQYPEVDDKVVTKQNVFLLTDGANITMPDMKGWSLKDVKQYAALSGMNITWSGSGSVSAQNIKSGENITNKTEIKLTLK